MATERPVDAAEPRLDDGDLPRLPAATLPRGARRALAGLGIGLAVLLSTTADARESSPVKLTEVASRVQSRRLGDVVELLRKSAETELAAIDWGKRAVRRPVVVSASLVRLDSTEA